MVLVILISATHPHVLGVGMTEENGSVTRRMSRGGRGWKSIAQATDGLALLSLHCDLEQVTAGLSGFHGKIGLWSLSPHRTECLTGAPGTCTDHYTLKAQGRECRAASGFQWHTEGRAPRTHCSPEGLLSLGEATNFTRILPAENSIQLTQILQHCTVRQKAGCPLPELCR